MSDTMLGSLVSRSIGRLTPWRRPAADAAHARDMRELRATMQQVLHRLERLEKSAAGGQERSAKRVEELRTQVRGLRVLVEQLLAGEKAARKLRTNMAGQVSALVRAAYLPTDVPAPLSLLARRFRLRSQHEEDGIVLALLGAAGVTRRCFVEIGSGSSGGNSGVLAADMGWRGLMVEARPALADKLRRKLAHNPQVAVVDTMISPENVNAVIAAHGLTGEIDVLSIDIDSIDYWVFEAIEVCTARVLVLEYNALFGRDRALTLPAAALPPDAPSAYTGASLVALEKLARRKGYGLVLCEDSGVNAFFLRDGLAPEIPRTTAEAAYRPRRADPPDVAPEPDEVLRSLAEAGLPLVEV